MVERGYVQDNRLLSKQVAEYETEHGTHRFSVPYDFWATLEDMTMTVRSPNAKRFGVRTYWSKYGLHMSPIKECAVSICMQTMLEKLGGTPRKDGQTTGHIPNERLQIRCSCEAQTREVVSDVGGHPEREVNLGVRGKEIGHVVE